MRAPHEAVEADMEDLDEPRSRTGEFDLPAVVPPGFPPRLPLLSPTRIPGDDHLTAVGRVPIQDIPENIRGA
jgi:hypothetical protein